MSGRKRSNFEFYKFHPKRCLSDAAWAQETDGIIGFAIWRLELPKIAFWYCGYWLSLYNEMKKKMHNSAIFVGIELKLSTEAHLYMLYHISSAFFSKNGFKGEHF